MKNSIIIKKDPNGYKNLPHNKEEFQPVINEVNLSDILDYIISAIEDNWTPNYYWPIKSKLDKMSLGQLEWVIYSYLINNKILIIENQYYDEKYYEYNESRTKKYKDRLSYYNPLEIDLYKPILNRMINEKYLIIDQHIGYFKIGPMYWRKENLIKLGI